MINSSNNKDSYGCLVVIPFKESYNSVFKRILSIPSLIPEIQLNINRADRSLAHTKLSENVKHLIVRTHILIIDVSETNPNVFFEYGFAVATGKICILISQKRNSYPTFVSDSLILIYENTPEGLDEFENRLATFITNAIRENEQLIQSTTPPVRFFSNRSLANLPLLISKAQGKIDILQTNLSSVSANLLDSMIKSLNVHSNLKIRLLTLDPDSPFSIYRSRQLGMDFSVYRRELISSIAVIYSKLGSLRERCAIRIYDDFPTQITFRIDDQIVYSVVSIGGRSRNNPVFIINRFRNSEFLKHFKSLWAQARLYSPREQWKTERRTLNLPQEAYLEEDYKGKQLEGERIKLTSIPYYFGSYINNPRDFFGRTDEIVTIIQKISEASKDKFWHVSIVGDYRSGKSSLLKRLEYEIESKSNSVSVYIDLSAISQEHFIKSVIGKLIDELYRKFDGDTLGKIKSFLSNKNFESLKELGVDLDVIGVLKIKVSDQ